MPSRRRRTDAAMPPTRRALSACDGSNVFKGYSRSMRSFMGFGDSPLPRGPRRRAHRRASSLREEVDKG